MILYITVSLGGYLAEIDLLNVLFVDNIMKLKCEPVDFLLFE